MESAALKPDAGGPISKALNALAIVLGVKRPAPFMVWLLRLFFQPPAAGRPDVVGIWFATLAPRLARAADLPVEHAWFDWPLRLLFRAPRAGQRDHLREALIRFTFRLADDFGVLEVYRPKAWIWRLFIENCPISLGAMGRTHRTRRQCTQAIPLDRADPGDIRYKHTDTGRVSAVDAQFTDAIFRHYGRRRDVYPASAWASAFTNPDCAVHDRDISLYLVAFDTDLGI